MPPGDAGGLDLSLRDQAIGRTVAHQTGGVSAREAALRLSAIACAATTKRRTSEPQATASDLLRSGVSDSAEETEALRTGGAAAASLEGSESGVGVGFRARCDGVRTSDTGAERGRCLYAGVSGACSPLVESIHAAIDRLTISRNALAIQECQSHSQAAHRAESSGALLSLSPFLCSLRWSYPYF